MDFPDSDSPTTVHWYDSILGMESFVPETQFPQNDEEKQLEILMSSVVPDSEDEALLRRPMAPEMFDENRGSRVRRCQEVFRPRKRRPRALCAGLVVADSEDLFCQDEAEVGRFSANEVKDMCRILRTPESMGVYRPIYRQATVFDIDGGRSSLSEGSSSVNDGVHADSVVKMLRILLTAYFTRISAAATISHQHISFAESNFHRRRQPPSLATISFSQKTMSTSQSINQSSQSLTSQSTQSPSAEASLHSTRQKSDPAWAHCRLTIEDGGKKKTYTCTHCNKPFKGGGINRVKQHLAGKPGEVMSCDKVDADTRFRMEENLKEIAKRKKRVVDEWDEHHLGGEAMIGDHGHEIPISQTAGNQVNNAVSSSSQGAKRRATEGIGNYFAPRTTPGSQPTIISMLASKEAVHQVDIAVATFFFENCIPMNALNSSSYQKMIDAIASIGPGYKGPNYHAMRTKLLCDMKKNVQLLVDNCRSVWAETGCTIMADGWQDQKNRQLINFLVYCPIGISFIRSIDASDVVKDSVTLCNLFVELVEFVGPRNVVHLVTDNAANYKAAGRLLNEKYPFIYWSPCAAHCLNLVLGDIGKMELVSSLAKRASLITKFIYNHGFLLAWLRKREGWTEVIRPGPTRFATTFIALKSVHKHQHDLQALVTSITFVESRYFRDPKARDFIVVVLDSKFWNDVGIVVKIVAPLIRLLRIVDGDHKPSLAYVYDGMHRAKKAIKSTFMNKRSLYKPYTRIIKRRWDKHLRQKLHAAAYVLNPAFFYDVENISRKPEVMAGFLDVLTTQVSGNQTEFLSETELYREKLGDFGRPLALKCTKTMRPDMWWKTFGNGVPNVKAWAIKILSQTTSSSGCERNWSVFERIHTKKMNRLEHQRLNDLVFVHYNLRLTNRIFNKDRAYDPIDYESIDDIEFWIMEEDTNTSSALDFNEIENMLYDQEAIPVNGLMNKDLDKDEDIPTNGGEGALDLDSFPQEDVDSFYFED